MLNGSKSPSRKFIITVSGNKAMSSLRQMTSERVFLYAVVSKAAGV